MHASMTCATTLTSLKANHSLSHIQEKEGNEGENNDSEEDKDEEDEGGDKKDEKDTEDEEDKDIVECKSVIYLLIIGQATHHSCIQHTVQGHAERVQLSRVLLCSHGQRAQLLVLADHCLQGVLNG